MRPCPVCRTACTPAFTKDFGGAFGLHEVRYEACPECGYTYSRTHLDLGPEAWGELNERYHLAYQHTGVNEDDPRWLERLEQQHEALALLGHERLLAPGSWLDWGCGDGRLALQLTADGVPMDRFDRFLDGPGYLPEADLRPRSHPLVLTTSVLEHLLHRHELDEIEQLVAPGGVFAFHTMVVERVLPDPSWFYLLPVHTAFFTNAAMGRLLAQWGYGASVYDVAARLWLACRHRVQADALAGTLQAAGREVHAGPGFVAYWRMDEAGRPFPMTEAPTGGPAGVPPR